MSEGELHIKIVNDPMFAENGMIVSFGRERPCWIIDVGLEPQAERMLAHIRDQRLVPIAIVLTHAHGDHIAGIDEVRRTHRDLPVYLARAEWHMLKDPNENLSAHHGSPVTANVSSNDLRDLAHGDRLTLDAAAWEVLDTSGHSPGGRTIYSRELGVAIVGDAIFAGSIGRVDFHHSDGRQLLHNIRNHLLTLPDETTLIPGHGPSTTVGAERRTNPFLRTF